MKYCEDVDCPNLGGEIGDSTDCKLGFHNPLITPRSMPNAVYGNWGHVMSKACKAKFILKEDWQTFKKEIGE